MKPWIGVDLDGTLAVYHDGDSYPDVIGEPVLPMVERVKEWLAKGLQVKIFTARVAHGKAESEQARHYIRKWLVEVAGLPELEVTCIKNYAMVELYDDRAVQVEFNTGRLIGESTMQHRKILQENKDD